MRRELNTQDLDEILGYSSSEILHRVERQHPEESKEMEPELPAYSPPPVHPPASATPPPVFDAEWEKVVLDRVEQLLSPGFLRNKRVTIANQRRTVERNVRAHIKQSLALGCTGPHHCASGCPGPFQPQTFYQRTQFAHYAEHTVKSQAKASGMTRTSYCLHNKTKGCAYATFKEFLKTGSSKWAECHNEETHARDEYAGRAPR